MPASTSTTRLITLNATADKTGKSRSAVYIEIDDEHSDFPKAVQVGKRKYFVEHEIDEWILSRPRVAAKSKTGGV